MTERQSVPPSIALLGAALLCAATWVLGASLLAYPPHVSAQFGLLIVAILLSENFALELSPFSSVSMSLPLTMAAVLIGGPGAGGLAAIASCANYRDFSRRRPLSVIAFNLGQIVLSACVGGIVYIRLGGQFMIVPGGAFEPLAGHALPRSMFAWIVAASISSLMNLILVGVGTTIIRAIAVADVARSVLSILPSQLALALIAFLIAEVLAVNPIAFPLFLFPLFLARQIYQRYARLRDEYLDTVRSLVSALEAKDPYTRGHSERVAKYACMLAERCGLDSRAVDSLQQAALLHDIGKLTLSGKILSKPSALSFEEDQQVRMHAQVGSEMVLRIPALRALSDYVKSHHERVDGTGYPDGLSGEAIPKASRILAIADAYDAMTSDRAYRCALTHAEAVKELRDGRGRQFDSDMVDVFIAAEIERTDAVPCAATPHLSVTPECAQ